MIYMGSRVVTRPAHARRDTWQSYLSQLDQNLGILTASILYHLDQRYSVVGCARLTV
jgi:hypothetical protein